MPIGITYNAGDLILQSVSSSGNTFQENKIAAATSSLILFNSSGNLTSQSLNATTVGTSSYLSGSKIIVSDITASNISASGYISASTFVGKLTGSLFGTSSWSTNSLTASSLISGNSYTITNLTASNISASATGSFGSVGIGTTSPTGKADIQGSSNHDLPTYSAEFLSASTWVSTGWTGSFSAGWTHITGNTSSLSHDKAAVTSSKYQIAYTVTGITPGSFTIAFGGDSLAGISATGAWGPTALSTASLAITPTTDFIGTIVISIKSITATSTALVSIKSSDGTARIEIRANNASANTFIGYAAGRNNTTGVQNTAIGYNSLLNNTTGVQNTAIGYNSLNSNTTGYSNTANGIYSLYSNLTGYYNTANGYASLYYNTTGFSNTANGFYSLFSNTTGYYNTANGYVSLQNNTTGIQNTANGFASLFSNTTGYNNTAYGYNAGRSLTTGNTNTFLGSDAGYHGSQSTSSVNSMALGYGAYTTLSNQVVIGNTSVTQTLLNGNVGIGTTNPGALLDVSGSSRHGYRSSDTHQFTGSVSISGSLNATSSWSTNSLTASSLISGNSYTITNLTASNISASATGSFGRVGIGTTSPAYLLDVSGSSRFGYRSADTHQFTGSVSISGSLNATSSWSTNALTASYVTSSNIVGTVTSASYALSASSAPTTITASWSTNALTASSLVVGNSYNITNLTASNISASGTGSFGRVGIGTTSPTAKLEISSSSASGLLHLKSPTSQNIFFVSGSGNVGIGNADPASKLSVSGNILLGNVDGENGFTLNWRGRSDLGFIEDGYSLVMNAPEGLRFNLDSNNNTTSTNFEIAKDVSTKTGGTVMFTVIESSGNVGIGTTNPAALLDVSGSSRHGYRSADTHQFTGSVSISGSLNATSSWATNSLTASYITASNVVGTVTSASYALSASSAPTTITASWSTNALTASSLVVGNSYNITNLTASNIGVSNAIINGNLTVTGSIFASLFSASNIYITSSTLTVTDNIITINALNPYQRYAGLEMYDSGSGTLSNFLWDSLNNYFFISSSDAGASRRVILGPIGEASLTQNYIPLISGSNNITSSVIYQSSGLIGIGLINPVNRLDVAGNISCSAITSSFFGTSSWATNSLTASSLVSSNSYTITNLTASNISTSATGSFGIVGIGTTAPGDVLHISSNGGVGFRILDATVTTGGDTRITQVGQKLSINTYANGHSFMGTPFVIDGEKQNVGIGTTSPVNKLDVAGNISCSVITASFFGTSSWATNSLTASYVTSSNVVGTVTSASYALSASFANTSSNVLGGLSGYIPLWSTSTYLTSSVISQVTSGLTGSIGINVTSPNATLQISSYNSSDTPTLGAAKSASVIISNSNFNYGIHFGSLSNGNGWIQVTRSDNTASAYNLSLQPVGGNVGIGTTNPSYQFVISNGGARGLEIDSGDTQINGGIGLQSYNRSTSVFVPIQIYGSKVILNGGNVGIGTTNPAALLDVSGSSRHGYRSADTHQFTGSVSISGSLNATSSWATNALTASYVTSSNVVGTVTSASYSLSSSFSPTTITASWATNALTASSLVVGNSYNITNLTASNISASRTGSFGMVGVGTSSPGAILEVSSSTALTIFNVKGAGGANLFTVSGSGNIGVGTTPSTSYKMQINGSFSATTKSFDIDHPVKSGKRLVYGSLESPYHGVRLTGKGKLVKGKGVIQLPDYMNALVDYDNPNVQITNIKHNKVIYVDGIDEKNNIINIAAKIPKTQLNKELEFYWTFTAVRKDVPPLQVEC